MNFLALFIMFLSIVAFVATLTESHIGLPIWQLLIMKAVNLITAFMAIAMIGYMTA